jgi:dihydroorotase
MNTKNGGAKMIDLYVKNGKGVDVQPRFYQAITAKKAIDLENKSFVSAGWVDDHVHVYEKMTLYYDTPDLDGVDAGVTTIIDAGSTGADNLPDFYQITWDTKTNVFAMCNISKTGIVAQDELGDLSRVQGDLVREMIEQYSEFVVGIKVRMSKPVVGNNGITPLRLAKEIQAANKNIPLMVHIGTNPPELSDIFALLQQGYSITHWM